MDIKGKKLIVEEIGKLDNGTKVWVENNNIEYKHFNGLYRVEEKDTRVLKKITDGFRTTYDLDYKEITAYEWLEDMVEIEVSRNSINNFNGEINITIIGGDNDFSVIRKASTIKSMIWLQRPDNKYYIKRGDMKTMEKQFTKSDLKSGMVVEYRNGEKNLFVKETFLNAGGHMCLYSYNDNLTLDMKTSSIYDIMKVYDTQAYELKQFLTDGTIKEDIKPIWERKETPITDWSKIPVDTLVEIKMVGEWIKRYFAGIVNGKISYYINGATSFTNDSSPSRVGEDCIRLIKE